MAIEPLLLTASDTGGAGTATRRIHEGLREIGKNSQMLVREKATDNPAIHGPNTKLSKIMAKLRPRIDALPLNFYQPSSEFSLTWTPDRLQKRVNQFDPDVVHLNWVANGYMNPTSISDFGCPVVWRLPDMWPLTGGCHYAGDCERYHSSCGNCPQLNSSYSQDPSHQMLKRKRNVIKQTDVTVVATSSWLASCARQSAIFQNCSIKIIPNGLNTQRFKPREPAVGRDLFNLPPDVPLILFGAVSPVSNKRKGFDLLHKAISEFVESTNTNAELAVFGRKESKNTPKFDLPTHYTGYLNDEESLALLYSAADIMIVPSRYEGFGQTITESMASGTPVVAFDTTGPKDTIVHKKTGYLATPYDPSDLAAGVEYLLHDDKRRSRISQNARARAVEKYHYTDIAKRYYKLYRSITR